MITHTPTIERVVGGYYNPSGAHIPDKPLCVDGGMAHHWQFEPPSPEYKYSVGVCEKCKNIMIGSNYLGASNGDWREFSLETFSLRSRDRVAKVEEDRKVVDVLAVRNRTGLRAAKEIENQERNARIIELRDQGMTLRALATRFQLAYETIRKIVISHHKQRQP